MGHPVNFSCLFILGYAENVTGCLRPCKFLCYEYSDEYVDEPSYAPILNVTGLSIGLKNKDVTVRRETYLYPLSSLVAETGGTLGLFLGFSFLLVYDEIYGLFLIFIWYPIISKMK